MKDLTANLTPRCAGRYLIDVPADAHIFQSVEVERVRVSAQPVTLDDHRLAMQERRGELNAAKSHFGYRFLYADHEVKGIPDSRYFISLGSIFQDPDSIRVIEAYRWSNGYQIKMEIEASSAKDSLYFKDQPSVRDDPDMTNVSERLTRVISLLSKARGRTDDEIPREPGTCFQGGFLAGKSGDRENLRTSFVLAMHRDVVLNLDSDTDIVSDDSLLQRGVQIAKKATHINGRTLRKGPVTLQSVPAEEWLMALTTSADVPGFHFLLEGNARIGDPRTPLINLALNVGVTNKLMRRDELKHASLTEGESVALWDTVSRTVRPRPNGF